VKKKVKVVNPGAKWKEIAENRGRWRKIVARDVLEGR